jgi:hypothetical protein
MFRFLGHYIVNLFHVKHFLRRWWNPLFHVKQADSRNFPLPGFRTPR